MRLKHFLWLFNETWFFYKTIKLIVCFLLYSRFRSSLTYFWQKIGCMWCNIILSTVTSDLRSSHLGPAPLERQLPQYRRSGRTWPWMKFVIAKFFFIRCWPKMLRSTLLPLTAVLWVRPPPYFCGNPYFEFKKTNIQDLLVFLRFRFSFRLLRTSFVFFKRSCFSLVLADWFQCTQTNYRVTCHSTARTVVFDFHNFRVWFLMKQIDKDAPSLVVNINEAL